MEQAPKRVYTKEFKEQAARLVVSDGLGLTEAARRLSISPKSLANWVAAAKHGKPVNVGTTRKPMMELEAEVARLKRELAEIAPAQTDGHSLQADAQVQSDDELQPWPAGGGQSVATGLQHPAAQLGVGDGHNVHTDP